MAHETMGETTLSLIAISFCVPENIEQDMSPAKISSLKEDKTE